MNVCRSHQYVILSQNVPIYLEVTIVLHVLLDIMELERPNAMQFAILHANIIPTAPVLIFVIARVLVGKVLIVERILMNVPLVVTVILMLTAPIFQDLFYVEPVQQNHFQVI